MKTKPFDPEIRAYLDRIGFEDEPDGSVGDLFRLQDAHLHAVPYENLDILNGIPLSLEIRDLYDKIVTRRRGGFCFETNALFGWLLQRLGYPTRHYFARFWRDEPNPPPKRRHQVLCAEAEGKRYLCDVGVGGIVPRTPLLLQPGLEQVQGDECYKLEEDSDYGWMLLERKHGQWHRIYSFTEEPQLAKDYLMASYWCEHAPDSIFRAGAMVAIRTREGRHTLAGEEFRLFTSDGVETFTPQTPERYRQALRTYFGIELER
ncbi:arylamine N-acetyltransferase [Paenibacillus sp. IB182496]|uniref:Arylamine N-acetyltransferase n=1 Tax=Paenibacillus sabuli TaxID=2772509 RepID=A0A927BV69_9BACL|nr:arylamine N-acetyltransferase [Paenibacillus sabuli]MBD2846501.1 arylamine N-acetyltransferase [Paenibacillus sabuli]